MSVFRHIPHLTLSAGNGENTLQLTDRALSFRLQQQLSSPSVCDILLQDDELYMPLTIGMVLKARLSEGPSPLFEGKITAITREKTPQGNRQTRLRAYDALHALRHAQHPRGFSDNTTAKIATTLLSEHALTLDTEDTGPNWPRILQTDQDDLTFLRQICAESGLYFTLSGTTVTLLSLSGRTVDIPHPMPPETSIVSFQHSENSDSSLASVTTHSWTPDTATSDSQTRDVPNSPNLTIQDGLALQIMGHPTQNAGQNGAFAQARLDRNAAHAHSLTARLDGNEKLRAGDTLFWQEPGALEPDTFVLTGVTHSLDPENGYLTEITTKPPKAAARSTACEITLGIVKSVADPRKMGRVQVDLSAYNNLRTDWIEVALPAAGARKGLIALPDKGDRVLVALAAGDPAQGIVLGGLFGNSPPSDLGVDGTSISRFLFQTPGGQRVILDDEKDHVEIIQSDGAQITLSGSDTRIEASNGSFLSLASQETHLHSETDLTLAAPGRKIKIAGRTVDFDKS